MKVPLLDLRPQTAELREELIAAVTRVIDSTCYILGSEVESFENKIAYYCDSGFAVGVSSGTDALVMSLMAMGIGTGDRVVTSPYSFFATMGAILRVGAKPVFADIDENSFNLSPAALADTLGDAIKKKEPIKAILPVHLFGQCADMGAILSLADQYDIPVIEDAAQAIGACCPVVSRDGDIEWKKAGSMGFAGCFSFFPSKNLGGIGDGGMVTTCDDKFDNLLRSFRNHGANPKYYHAQVGGNFRLDPVQAVVLDIKLNHLEKWHRQRRENSKLYRKLFAGHNVLHSAVVLPVESYAEVNGADNHVHHIYNQFVIRVRRRDELRAFLDNHSIGCEVYYPVCLHKQECVRQYNGLEFPVAERAAGETLALPVYPELSDVKQVYVVDKIAEFYSSL
jgi:dTDP-4-amino-4,6-dideoxygalactose transaminase